MTTAATSQRLDIEANVALANERLDGLGWTDGLPVIPPTEELVRAMLTRSPHDPGDVLGRMQPLDGVVTVERVAREHGVIVRAMSSLYVEAPAQSALMLGFSGYPRQTIAPAIARLARAFER